MKRMQYLVRINRDPRSDWGASVPDLPGCVATGKTLDSALRRIEQAIALHVQGLREDGLPVPRPRQRASAPGRGQPGAETHPRAGDGRDTASVHDGHRQATTPIMLTIGA